jgi:hypothetical protein
MTNSAAKRQAGKIEIIQNSRGASNVPRRASSRVRQSLSWSERAAVFNPRAKWNSSGIQVSTIPSLELPAAES